MPATLERLPYAERSKRAAYTIVGVQSPADVNAASLKKAQHRFVPRGGALELMYCHDQEVVLCGPAETGKTYAACWKAHLIASKYPGCVGVIVRKTANSLHPTVLQTFKRVTAGAPIIPFGGERPERYIYANGSTIWVGGMDNAEKVLSGERDFIYVCQAEELTLNDWEILTTRCTGRGAIIPHPQIFGDCNPSSTRHWLRARAESGRLNLLRSVHEDNPSLYDDDGEITEQGRRTMAVLDSLTGVRRRRLRDGQWATAEGAVYDTFDSTDGGPHVRVRSWREMQRFVLGFDEGYTNPAVILLTGIDGDGRLHVFREFYQRGVVQSDLCAKSAEWFKDPIHTIDESAPVVKLNVGYAQNVVLPCEAMIADDAAAGFIAEVELPPYNVRAYGAGKGKVMDGVELVRSALVVQQDGLARLSFDPSCVNTINDFESYRMKSEKDEPLKEDDHGPDTVRYVKKWLAGQRGQHGDFEVAASLGQRRQRKEDRSEVL